MKAYLILFILIALSQCAPDYLSDLCEWLNIDDESCICGQQTLICEGNTYVKEMYFNMQLLDKIFLMYHSFITNQDLRIQSLDELENYLHTLKDVETMYVFLALLESILTSNRFFYNVGLEGTITKELIDLPSIKNM